MKRKILTIGMALAIGFGSYSSFYNVDIVSAVTKNKELENQKSEVKEKRSDLQTEMQGKEAEIADLQAEQAKLNEDIKRLDLAVAETNGNIREKEMQIAETKQQIEVLKAEIIVTEERIAKRDELLNDRLRSLQQSGGMISYLDVLLGAKSFGDFIDRVSAVSQFVQADKDIIEAHQADKLLKEEQEAEVTRQLASLEEKLNELEGLKETLKVQIEEKNVVMAELQTQEQHVHEQLEELEDEEKLLAQQEAAIKRAIEEWNRKQKELEEARKKQQASGGSSGAPAVTSGNFMKPTVGRLTSGYGQRWGTLHAGVDIANGDANVPVVSAADGIVFRSYYSSSYGNVVFITHNIEGQVFTTVYAHLESRSVSEGQVVSKGTMLGYMGNTGYSYGKHLHFELHKGPWNSKKSNSVDPRLYINF
ncbi:peptidoglycan DD-metalloendopeptidase family protein [Bacillus timonensis]|nr:peptidoglycan DD-metalloendopeptidase family protein [Bacillus timonensis]